MLKKIKKVVTGTTQYDGAGVKLVRVLSYPTVTLFDPFLMLDAFDSLDEKDYEKGFPWHPHRGIETVTYLISGDIEHQDSLGNKGSILDGECQWMTAGSGILHQEMPKACERMLGVQLWLNLPKKDKMTQPEYRDIKREMVPVYTEDAGEIRVISGQYEGIQGAVQGDYVKTLFLDVSIQEEKEWKITIEKENTLFVYIVEGEGYFEEDSNEVQKSKRALLFGEGNELKITTKEKGVRFLLFAGKPLKEPIVWGGPIVMNTKQELDLAFQEIEEGNFIK